MRKIILSILPLLAAVACSRVNPDDALVLGEQGYFERQGVNVLVFSNTFNGGFNDEKNSGIEIIHHGVRTVQGGAVRLSNTPEQWDLVPQSPERVVDTLGNTIEVALRYPDYDFDSRIVTKAEGKAVRIEVWLDKPVPAELEGDAGFNIELLPSQYWQKTYVMDGKVGRFPRYSASLTTTRPNEEKVKQFKGYRTYDDRGTGRFVDPLPLVSGHELVVAPDDPERLIRFTSEDAEISLYDGRLLAQNGWYVLRSVLPAGKTGKVLSWLVEPNAVEGWVREPNVGFSQVGYLPRQQKVAVIELDKRDKPRATAEVWRVREDGTTEMSFFGKIQNWGPYFKYNYVKFDFSPVQEPGVYFLRYGDVWIPIHMNHMMVNEAYRIWHGEPFKEGYLQAPANTDHFDLHSQGPIDTKYKAYQLIPGLNVGGFFDAGDFDIETGSNISVVQNLVSDWERFKPMRDETFVSEEQRYVDLHRPDGVPDVIQYIEHGTLNLVAQAENIGHMAQTLSNSVLDNYHHLGDAAAITDGLHYDPRLKPYQKSADGKSSGTPDDMWAFTTRNPFLDLQAATMFAAASRALTGYNDGLAARALKQSKRLMKEGTELMQRVPRGANMRGRGGFGNMSTNLQLYVSTGEKQYLEAFQEQIWPALERGASFAMQPALDAIPYLDDAYKTRLRPYVEEYKHYLDSLDLENPYGVPIGRGNWAASGGVVSFGTTAAFASKYFPDIIGPEYALKAAAFMFGCHPYHNYSLVAAVGAARPKAVFYGNNRADFSFIPGNVAPGVLFRNPDHFENFDDWPFLWGQNEGTIAGNTAYLIFGTALQRLVAD